MRQAILRRDAALANDRWRTGSPARLDQLPEPGTAMAEAVAAGECLTHSGFSRLCAPAPAA
ncbi:hypothetical protein WJ438_05025 [Streptomyces sp. GD-15H]|uniref:hypothetical protein n=1 Tax=Streptomyces sp. GD-15H TaxID=3129112 RepID=UPI003246B5E4